MPTPSATPSLDDIYDPITCQFDPAALRRAMVDRGLNVAKLRKLAGKSRSTIEHAQAGRPVYTLTISAIKAALASVTPLDQRQATHCGTSGPEERMVQLTP